MALQTLLASQREAAPGLGIDIKEIDAIQEPRIVMEGQIDLTEFGGPVVDAYRAHSGRPTEATGGDFAGLVGKGGIRMAHYPSREAAVATVKELSVEMLSKLALRGRTNEYMGAKGLIVVDSLSIDHAAKVSAARQYEGLMEAANLAGYKKDVPAGDVGTNGLGDDYARAYRERNPNDPYWQASITGKSPEMGGHEFRTRATGWGGYVTQLALMNAKGYDKVSTTVQGFGNVAAWHSHFATTSNEQRIFLSSISDRDGVLHTDDPAGITITEQMVTEIGDNPYFTGPKIHALQEAVAKDQPGLKTEVIEDSSKILNIPTNFFVPAAMGNVITDQNVEDLGADLGIIEDANGPTSPAAHRYLTDIKKLIIAPDFVANGVGVDCSIEEIIANVTGLVPPVEQLQKELTRSSEQVVREMLVTANVLKTPDMRVGAAGLSMAYMLKGSQPGILRELIAA
jgi:glutamate dehydrogenase (NAD(P)+)